MSRTNVEAVRGAYEAFNTRDAAAIHEMMLPDAEFRTTIETHRGAEGVIEWVNQADRIFDFFELTVVEALDLGDDRVLAVVHERARGNDSGIEIDHDFAHVWTFRGGRVAAFQSYADRASAVEAVGLLE